MKNQVNPIPKLKSSQARSPTWKTRWFRPHHWNQVNFDAHSNIESISMPRHKNRVNFSPFTWNDSFSTAARRPSHFRSLHWKLVNSDPHWNQDSFDHPHSAQINFMPTLKSSQVRPPTLKSDQFRPHTINQVNFIAHTGTKWFSARTQKIKSIPIPHTEIVSNTLSHSKMK